VSKSRLKIRYFAILFLGVRYLIEKGRRINFVSTKFGGEKASAGKKFLPLKPLSFFVRPSVTFFSPPPVGGGQLKFVSRILLEMSSNFF
jgi:hypothetical protein